MAPSDSALNKAFVSSTRLKPNRRRIGLAASFMVERTQGRGEGELARAEGAEPEAGLQHQRQQERQRPDPDPEQEAADHRGAEGRHPQEAQIDHRMGDPAGMPDVEQDADHADPEQSQGGPVRHDAAARWSRSRR